MSSENYLWLVCFLIFYIKNFDDCLAISRVWLGIFTWYILFRFLLLRPCFLIHAIFHGARNCEVLSFIWEFNPECSLSLSIILIYHLIREFRIEIEEFFNLSQCSLFILCKSRIWFHFVVFLWLCIFFIFNSTDLSFPWYSRVVLPLNFLIALVNKLKLNFKER